MRNQRYYRYNRPNGFGPRWLMYQLALVDSKLRHALNLGSHCGIVMFLTWLMTVIVLVCSLMCVKASATNEKDFLTLRIETEKKFPRKKSVTDIGPAYNCVRKHLQQTDVFQEKTKKMLRKELLELEILNSRINCINKLLKSERSAAPFTNYEFCQYFQTNGVESDLTQSKWQRNRLPKVYYRPIDSSASK